MKKTVFLLLTLFPCLLLEAQTTFSCSYNGSYETLNAYSFENDELEDDAFDVPGLVNRILKAYNLPSSVITIIPSAQVNNALSTVKEGKPFILYSKYFVENIQNKHNGNWKLIGIFAHEVGHHILFHTIGDSSSRHKLELEADKWAGAALYKLGATKTQALSCVEETNEAGSYTHPPRVERKLAVRKGWDEAQQQSGVVPTPKADDKLTTASEYTENAMNSLIVMKKIPGGTFSMGSNDVEATDGENPIHSVTISGFYMGKYEVTQKQWRVIVGTNPSKNGNCDDCPVNRVSWKDVQIFITKLNEKSEREYRLPTEAEWEYAAKGGQNYKYAGSYKIEDVAWYSNNSGSKTRPVGQKTGNDYGLFDMSGNVGEWCEDRYGKYSSRSSTNPRGPLLGGYRIYRGGSYTNDPRECRLACRRASKPSNRSSSVGFRLVSPND